MIVCLSNNFGRLETVSGRHNKCYMLNCETISAEDNHSRMFNVAAQQ